MSKPLIDPLINIPSLTLPSDVRIKELTCESEMHWAAEKLNNCINNPEQKYKEKIKSGVVKIFVITTPNSTSALELQLDSVDALEVKEKQLLSTCNRSASRYHRVISDILITHINTHLLKSKYKNKIKIYNDLMNLQTGLLITTTDDSTVGNTNPDYPFFNADVDRIIVEDLENLTPEFIDNDEETINIPYIDETPTLRVLPNHSHLNHQYHRGGEPIHIREWIDRTVHPPLTGIRYESTTTLGDINPDGVSDMF